MKKLLVLFTLLVVSATTFAQKKETRNVSTFTRISFRSSGVVYVKQGTPQKVEIEGSAEALERIKTRVEDGKLIIGPEEKWMNWSWDSNDDVTVYVTVASIEALSVSGSGKMEVQTRVTANALDLNVSGSGSLKVEAEAGEVDADVSGSGEMTLRGKYKSFSSDISGSGEIIMNASVAEKAEFEISGSGKVKATGTAQTVKASISGSGKVLGIDFQTDTCDVRISGSGDVEIGVKTELNARISGSGSVIYKGDPARVHSDASGSGKVRKI